ncbi:MAG: hypothetical protein WAK55_29705 [Xanthobacteraceae bacterium]
MPEAQQIHKDSVCSKSQFRYIAHATGFSALSRSQAPKFDLNTNGIIVEKARHAQRQPRTETMAKVIAVLYPDPVDGYPKRYAGDDIPKVVDQQKATLDAAFRLGVASPRATPPAKAFWAGENR